MKINLYLCYGGDVEAALAADPDIAGQFKLGVSAFWVDGESEAFDRILELTKTTSGLRLTPDCVFTAKEQSQARYFQVLSRKRVKASMPDNLANLAHVKALTPVKTAEGLAIKRMERIELSKVVLDANTVAVLDDWAAEYLAGANVAELLKKAGLKGLELRPVYHRKTKAPHEGVFQLYTESVMPPVERNISVLGVRAAAFSEDSPVRMLGALSYALDGAPELADFNRTAEPFSSNQLPFWVVSRKVVELFQEHEVKGWVFRPVLETGTALYKDHLARWEVLRKKLASNPRHHFAV
ncbi:hypothetical protein ACN28E_11965 [Archangium lansingense]|uniref:hypothetical protein n=1 Tax=Archangium lansingense TaxID=2995310 RepID=UPI003B7727EC